MKHWTELLPEAGNIKRMGQEISSLKNKKNELLKELEKLDNKVIDKEKEALKAAEKDWSFEEIFEAKNKEAISELKTLMGEEPEENEVQKIKLELNENLVMLMIDSTLKRLSNNIENDNGKNPRHTQNLKKRKQEILKLLETLT